MWYQIFTTYKKNPRKHRQYRNNSALEEDDESQQKQYEYIQSLEIQEESLTGEIGQVHEEKDTQETKNISDEVIEQTKKINLFLE